jgi:hemolysin activation/secretion protein
VLLPEQDIVPAEGKIRLQVVEGVLGAVRVEGGGPSEQKLVESQLDGMPIGKPFNQDELESRFLSIRKTPGLTIQPVFVPSKDKSGCTDLVFKIGARRYVDGALSYNNTGNYYVGVHRGGIDATGYNLVGRSKTKFSHLQSTRKDLLAVDRVRQTQLIGNNGARAYLEYVNVVARPQIPLVNKNSYKYANLMFMYPLIYERNSNLRVRVALDGQNDTGSYNGGVLKNDHIRAGRVGMLYNLASDTNFWEFSAIASQGFDRAFGARKTSTPSRAGGRNNFRHVVGRGMWVHKLNNTVSFLNMAGLQYSGDPLLATEEFAVGSSNYLRGYDSTETTGDSGWGALTEMRVDTHPSIKSIDSMQFYTSFGGARVRNYKQKSSTFEQESLASFALGVRGVHTAVGERVKERRFADVRESHDAE